MNGIHVVTRLAACAVVVVASSFFVHAQRNAVTYQVDPGWPKMPPGMHFGTKGGFPADRKESPFPRGAAGEVQRPKTTADGVSGLAIDDQDRIYVINRGVPPVMVFDRNGKYLKGGGEKDVEGQQIATGWTHSGAVDRHGNVWLIERDGHRLLKFGPALDKAVLQIGTTGVKGADATHLDLPSGVAVLRNGNVVVTDGYGNNRVVMFDPSGKFLKQVGKGAGGPADIGTGTGEFSHPHKLATDAADNIYVVDRGNRRVQVFDKELNFLRQFGDAKWVPWDLAISRKGNEGFGFFIDNPLEEIKKVSLKDGAILAAFGSPGRAPGQFDSVHGVVVDSKGAVYAGDTYGQRVQKFVPVTAREAVEIDHSNH
jgi:tripartite motif-containing protein 71